MRILGSVEGVAPDGASVAPPSTSQRRLLAVLAVHAPRSLRVEWLADVWTMGDGKAVAFQQHVDTAKVRELS